MVAEQGLTRCLKFQFAGVQSRWDEGFRLCGFRVFVVLLFSEMLVSWSFWLVKVDG